MNDAHARLS